MISRVFVCLLLLLSTYASGQSKEISLFNAQGKATAYIATAEDSTIYSWDGYPQAYLFKEKTGIHVFGFNGKHLGWFEHGIIYNHKGHIVGFVEDAVIMFTEPVPYKPIKKSGPFRAYQEIIPLKPQFLNVFSKQSLSAFLKQGIDN